MMGGGLHAAASNLGFSDGDTYYISDECEENLIEMRTSLWNENHVTRAMRRCYAASRIIEEDLFPVLIASEEYPEVFCQVVQLLRDLSMPVEITMPFHSSANMEENRSREVQRSMLLRIKKQFAKKEVADIMMQQMQCILNDHKAGEEWDDKTLHVVEECFKFIRNVLHIPGDDINIKIIHNLLAANLGDVIYEFCLTQGTVSMVNSILSVMCFLFKDHDAKDLRRTARKMLKKYGDKWLCEEDSSVEESFLSSSSEDEKETTASEETMNLDREQPSPSTAVQSLKISQETDAEEEEERKAMKKRLKLKLVKFMVKFVQGPLCNILRIVGVAGLSKQFEDLHFLLDLTYLLPLAKLSVIKYHHLQTLLSPPVLSALSYLILKMYEKYTISQRNKKDSESNSHFKCLHLLVTCQHRYFSALLHFSQNNCMMSKEEQQHLQNSIINAVQSKSVRDMYILLLRKFQSNVETISYLTELISGNDKLLLLAQHVGKDAKFEMREHILHFAKSDMMLTFNHLLQKFSTNSFKLNERVVNMLHHIAIDLERVSTLCQEPILKTISDIWEEDCKRLSQESYELFDYIVYSFCLSCYKYSKGKGASLPFQKSTAKRKAKGKKRVRKLTRKEALLLNLGTVSDKGIHCIPSSDEEEVVRNKRKHELTLEENIQCLNTMGYGKELKKIQDILLEICYLKLDCPKNQIAEPHVWPYSSMGKSVPVVAYTEEEESLQGEEIFLASLQQLGIQVDSSNMYPTIPSFWTADMCFETAEKLGPMDPANFKFEVGANGKPVCDSQPTYVPDMSVEQDKPSSSNPSEHLRSAKYQMSSTAWLTMIQAGNRGLD